MPIRRTLVYPKDSSHELGYKTSAQMENFDCQYHRILVSPNFFIFLVKHGNLCMCASPEATLTFKLRPTLQHFLFVERYHEKIVQALFKGKYCRAIGYLCFQTAATTKTKHHSFPVMPLGSVISISKFSGFTIVDLLFYDC